MVSRTQPSSPSLTNVTLAGRQGVKVIAILVVVIIVGRIFLNAFTAYWSAAHPPPPAPPTVGFGVLPAIEFPDPATNGPTSYTLETANGRLPTFPEKASVYFMPKKPPSLLDHENAVKFAASYSFVFEPQILNSTTYRWTKPQPLNSTLELNIRDYIFQFNTDFLDKPELLLQQKLPSSFEAVNLVRGFLERTDLLNQDIATSSGEVTYLKASGNELEEALSASDADIMQVDINRWPVNNIYKFYTSDGKNGVIHALVSGYGRSSDQIIKLDFNYYPIDYQEVHTYPLKSIKEAWNIIQSGGGMVFSEKQLSQGVIREVELGYYENLEGQDYLQPIYVFKGDGGLMVYVPAVSSEYTAPN